METHFDVVGSGSDDCRHPAGIFVPIVDHGKCEGESFCADVCPYNVFEVGRIHPLDFARLSAVGRLKSMIHGRMTAYTPNADACHGCGLCVAACPERAITLAQVGTASERIGVAD
jgi:NAD-dependent dihydropyrimidine dehydrogenase PreA subunit